MAMIGSRGGTAPLPPGPKGRKLYNVRQRLSRHSEFMDELHAEHGDIVFFEIPARKCAAVFSAELIHEVLVEQEPYFQPYYPKTSYNLIPSPCLATSRFETHTELEKVMSAAFTPERMPAYGRRSSTTPSRSESVWRRTAGSISSTRRSGTPGAPCWTP